MKKMITTLSFLRKDNKILLARKIKGFGTGKLNGVGGKVEPGESIIDGMIRETEEEIRVTPVDYQYYGKVEFDEFIKGEPVNLTFHVFVVTSWTGEIGKSEEMEPYWFDVDDIPYDEMFEDDIYWLPIVLKGKKVDAYFRFDENWNIVEKKIEEIEL